MKIYGWLMGVVWAVGWAAPLAASTPAADTARILKATHHQVGRTLIYDSRYQPLAFPGGDLPLWRGVCADVVVRALRGAGIDLQLQLNRDMGAHFAAYPNMWGMRGPDSNIDHRRVPNLETYFRRHGMALKASKQADDYQPGDIVSWRLEQGAPHIGIVTERRSRDGLRPLVIHNKGWGAREEDVLFSWQVIGHFRYFSASSATRLR
ncbi:DUF1287 domain-containing protein [Dyella tabacisoli]|uniref:DUF1287 domain-containing protein n=1 Tax=Dyella tabacisoli TaxID=2282381 RepID=A0A369UTS0_9GAMM|nr:DUF1287 domain-containing protein [Dyella tabacisoli]RDD83445.1 DUF1287 domain-containing protein [Dyella tabacisoli]